MNLLNRFRAWMSRDVISAIDAINARIDMSSDREVDAIVKLASSCESLERSLTDRMDIIEGRLDEMKPASQPETVSAGGHKRWTQRRDERVSKHFNVSEFVAKLQKAGTDGE
jgi:hypothetical protein